MTVVVTLSIAGGLKVFDIIYVLTNGGPGFDTQVLATYTYQSFSLGFLGESSAGSVILAVIVVIISFTMNRYFYETRGRNVKKKHAGKCILFLFMVALALLYVIPFFMMGLGSFKTQAEAARFDLALPSKWLFSNYTHVLESGKYGWDILTVLLLLFP